MSATITRSKGFTGHDPAGLTDAHDAVSPYRVILGILHEGVTV